MDILTLVGDLKAPSSRFRVLQYEQPLRKLGIRIRTEELPGDRAARRDLFRAAGDFDAVLLHRRLLGGLDYRSLRRNSRRLIYDFDDAVMFRDSNASRLESRRRSARFRRAVGEADLVLAGNSYLARMAGPHARRVIVIPSVVDLAPYPDSRRAGTGGVIGWMGSRSNFVYLELLREVLPGLYRNRPGIRFRVVSDGVSPPPGIRAEMRAWNLSGEVDELLDFDLGVMPLQNDFWSRGKCGLKIIQYFAAFLPVVCSPVGANLEIVREGENGYFARDKEEWRDRIDELLSSPEKRERLGRAGRKLVEENYSLSVMVPKIAEALRSVVHNS